MPSSSEPSGHLRSQRTGRDWVWLAALAAVFLAWHVPLIYRTSPGQDEDWYGVPGITILQTGLPQIPYIPSRDPASVCYRADVALYALPPLGFYLQALVHLVLGVGIGPARMASVLAGLAAVYLTYDLSRRWFDDRRGALLAATLYTLSRAFFFPATTARPDLAAVVFGLLAIRCVARPTSELQPRTALAAGTAAGLSLLAHPFGAVPTVQVILAILAGPGRVGRRLLGVILAAGMAFLVLALWIPLIALHPDLFRIQFGGNVTGRAGPGLGRTLLTPVGVLGFQARQFRAFVGPAQAGLYVAGLVWALLRARSPGAGRDFCGHLGASVLLLALLEGRHPTLGYYAYPAALASIAVGMLGSAAADRLGHRVHPGGATVLVLALLLIVLLPGAGLRTLWAHSRHALDPAYDARAVAHAILVDVPPGARAAVDGEFVMEFYLDGRPVVEAIVNPFSYDVRSEPFEYAVFGRDGLEKYRPRIDGLIPLKTYGDQADPFAPYAELYRRDPPYGARRETGTGRPAR